jgi:hypothetical protein
LPVEAGIYRRNRVKDAGAVAVDCSARDERILPQTYVDYACASARVQARRPLTILTN